MSRVRCRSDSLRWAWLLIAIGVTPLPAAQEAASVAAQAETRDDPILGQALAPWTGDLRGILERGMLRGAVPFGLSTHFMDGPEQRGLTYDNVLAFEQAANLTLVILPTNRAGLLPMLTEGRADLAAGTITVSEERRAIVDFSEPFHTEVREVLVTGPAAPDVTTAEDNLSSSV